MIYIFVPMYAEAAPLIQLLHLKRTESAGSLSSFSDGTSFFLTLTGTGVTAASSAAAAVLAYRNAGRDDTAVLYGSAAAVCGARKGMLYQGIKLKDLLTGIDRYPDAVTACSLENAVIFTGSALFHGEALPVSVPERTLPVLYDMESAAFFQAASLFLAVHQIAVLRFVTDNGVTDDIDGGAVKEFSSGCVQAAAEFCSRMQRRILLPRSEDCSSDADRVNRMLHGSETMRLQVQQLIRYCTCAGIDWKAYIGEFEKQGVLPSETREEGKKVLNVLRRKICG